MFRTRSSAAAYISGGAAAPELRGAVEFFPRRGGVLVAARIEGLPADNPSGFFALHIHETGDCSGEGFPLTGGHYNPAQRPHPMHAGDLPPLLRLSDGSAYLAVLTDRFSLGEIVGRSVVIHGGADDFRTQPSGNSGQKIGCGVIRMR